MSVRATGQVLAIRKGVLDPKPLTGLPAMHLTRTTGMLDMALHPKFAENKWIYFTYHKPLDGDTYTLALARGRYDGTGFSDVKDLYVGNAVRTGGSRLTFAPDGLIYITVGGAGRIAGRAGDQHDLRQDAAPEGRRHRAARQSVRRQGGQPAGDLHDRPSRSPRHRGVSGERPDFRRGARTARRRQDQYPQAGRELRLADLRLRTRQRRLADGLPPAKGSSRRGSPGIRASRRRACCSTPATSFRSGRAIIFVGSIQRGRIPGTGALERVVFNDKLWELRRETILQDFHQRVRDVRQGPDGLIYLLTEEDDGAVIRIEPVK